MSIQVGPQGGAIVSRYLVSTDPAEGYFTSIQDAIDQAVAERSGTQWALILVKSSVLGGQTFSENLSIPTNIHLKGFSEFSTSVASFKLATVTINGAISVSGSPNFIIEGFQLTNVGGTIFASSTAGNYFFKECSFSSATTAFSITGTASNAPELSILGCVEVGVTTFISWTPASAQNATSLNIEDSNILNPISINSNVNNNFIFSSQFNIYQSDTATIQIDNGTGYFSYDSFVDITGATLLNVDSVALCSNCWFYSVGEINSGTGPVALQNCTRGELGGIGIPAMTSIDNNLVGTDPYNGSEKVSSQAQAQTTDATVTTLLGITLNELESITLKGTITAAQSDHTNMVGGSYEIQVRRASGGNVTLVGSPIINVNSSSAATFDCDVDTGTQTVRVRITGVAATTYNWVTQYTYQKVLTEA